MTAPKDASMDSLIRLDHVHVRHKARSGGLFRRDAVHALTDASLEIRRGEILGLVGESGCGKSTLARVVTGLQRPTEGQVRFRGQDLWSLSPAQRREQFGPAVGVVFQDPSTALNPGSPYAASSATRWTCTGAAHPRNVRRGSGSSSTWSACPATRWRRCPGSSPAASANGWPSPARSRSTPS